jgi:hypothetical protein
MASWILQLDKSQRRMVIESQDKHDVEALKAEVIRQDKKSK